MSNPQAFPCLDSSGGGLSMRDPGMTLRDYFAGQCILASPGDDYSPAEFARAAYALADAMLAERERT
jgi:hypothetical protein